jgi:hypothetical protein
MWSVMAASVRRPAQRRYCVTSWGSAIFEVAGGGLDADHLVASLPAVERQDRASAARDDSDERMGEACGERARCWIWRCMTAGDPTALRSAASPTRTVTVRPGSVQDRGAAHPLGDHAVNLVWCCAVVYRSAGRFKTARAYSGVCSSACTKSG